MSNQKQLPMLSEMPAPKEVDMQIVKRCQTEAQAIAMCFNLSGYAVDTLSERLGVNKGTISKVVRGRAPIPRRVSRIAFMQACGNVLPMQWEAWKSGYQLVDRNLIAALQERAA